MNNRRKKSEKCTHLTAAALKRIRLEIGYDMRAMATALGGMPYRTYQDYEYGKRSIPEAIVDAVRELRRRDRDFMESLRRRLAADIARRFPAGIPSAPEEV